jgi:uncharacterized protein involved in exopolysaccharide biosynthesis
MPVHDAAQAPQTGSDARADRDRRPAFPIAWFLSLTLLVGAPGLFLACDVPGSGYAATATLWVESTGDEANGGPTGAPDDWDSLLRSHRLLVDVVREHQLHLPTPDRQLRDAGSPGADESALHREMREREASRALSRRLHTIRSRDGNVLHLRLEGVDPAETAATLNSLTERLVALAAERERSRFEETLTVLERQLEKVERDLDEAERQRTATGEPRSAGRVWALASIYAEVRGRLEATRLAMRSSIPDVRVLTRAEVPDRRSDDLRLPLVAALVAGWLAAALAGVLLSGRNVAGPDTARVHAAAHAWVDRVPALAVLIGALLALLATALLLP